MIVFEKYHGTGNDFILTQDPKLINPKIIQGICDRHFGIGADGVMIASLSKLADIKMTYFNSDGSSAPMCGNGMRCFAHYVVSHGLVNKTEFLVETLAGIIKVTTDEKLHSIKLNLGEPIFELQEPDVSTPVSSGFHTEIEVNKEIIKVHILILGTLHAVVYLDENPGINILESASLISNHRLFPKQINVNFVEVIDNHCQKVTTYERGSGWTLSCGTGCCASAVVSYVLHKTNNYVKTIVSGGELFVNVASTVDLIGPAVKIASGIYEVNL